MLKQGSGSGPINSPDTQLDKLRIEVTTDCCNACGKTASNPPASLTTVRQQRSIAGKGSKRWRTDNLNNPVYPQSADSGCDGAGASRCTGEQLATTHTLLRCQNQVQI